MALSRSKSKEEAEAPAYDVSEYFPTPGDLQFFLEEVRDMLVAGDVSAALTKVSGALPVQPGPTHPKWVETPDGQYLLANDPEHEAKLMGMEAKGAEGGGYVPGRLVPRSSNESDEPGKKAP